LNNVKGLLDIILSHVGGLQHTYRLHYVISKSGHRDLENGPNPKIKLPYVNSMGSNPVLDRRAVLDLVIISENMLKFAHKKKIGEQKPFLFGTFFT